MAFNKKLPSMRLKGYPMQNTREPPVKFHMGNKIRKGIIANLQRGIVNSANS